MEAGKRKFLQPLQKYQFFKTLRQKSSENRDASYPHYFQLKDEAQESTHLWAY
jgi:hypothetical protein